jgi:repressor LexA
MFSMLPIINRHIRKPKTILIPSRIKAMNEAMNHLSNSRTQQPSQSASQLAGQSASQTVPPRRTLTTRQAEVLDFLQRYIRTSGFPPTIVEICREFNMSSTNAATQFLLALEHKGYIKRASKGASRGIHLLDERGERITPQLQHMPSLHTSAEATLNAAFNATPDAAANNTPETSKEAVREPAVVSAVSASSVRNVVIIGSGSSVQPMSVFLSPSGQVSIDMNFFLPPTEMSSTTTTTTALAAMSLFAAPVLDDGMTAAGIKRGDLVVARQQFHAEAGDCVVALVQDTVLVRRLEAIEGTTRLSAATQGFPPVPYRGNDAAVAVLGVVVGVLRRF